METDVVDGVFPRFCFLAGGSHLLQVRNLVLDRWRTTVLGGVARRNISGSGI